MLDPAALRRVGEADYAAAAVALLPVGWAWPTEPGSVAVRFFTAIGGTVAAHHAAACDLMDDAWPPATRDLLPDWERALALPDPCTPAGERTVEARRAEVVEKLPRTGGQSIAYFEGLCAALGYAVTIAEHRPFVCGFTECGGGHELGAETIRHHWTVTVHGPRITYFRAGDSECGRDPLVVVDQAQDLECLLRRLKPAHTHLTVDYEAA